MSKNKIEFSDALFQSPVKATPTTSPADGSDCKSFVFYSDGTKSKGLTPNGKTEVALKPYEGSHHQTFKSPGNSLYQDEKDFYTATTFDAKYKFLLLALSNLKTRIDTYYDRKQKTRNQGHYTYTYRSICMCIHMLQEMVNLPEHVKSYPFLDRLNDAIQHASFDENLYNPIDMLPCYDKDDYLTYDKRKIDKQSELRTPLTKNSINAIPVDLTALVHMGVPKKGVPVVHPPPAFSRFIRDSDPCSDFAVRLLGKDDTENKIDSSSISSDNATQAKRKYGVFEAIDTSHEKEKSSLLGVSFLLSPKSRTPNSASRKKLKPTPFTDNSEDKTDNNAQTHISIPS
ncbi:MAG: hypothetical protein P1U32_04915 [Legionellaceae bacterium]|nr:hypothetical protein [Legionellaceae bacterium]